MTDNEINRAVQYVVASTSYGRDTVADIIRIGFAELSALATSPTKSLNRDSLLEYVIRWTMTKTGHPEPLVREVLGCAGRWLDELYETLVKEHPELLRPADS